MKKYLLIVATIILFFNNCSDDYYDSLNRDPNNPTQVTPDALFTSSTTSLFNQLESTNVNTNVGRMLAQYWTETTYTDEANYDLNNRNIPLNHWSTIYRDVLYDLKNASQLLPGTDAVSVNKKAQIELLSIYAWQNMVDTYGNIPYKEALQGKDDPTPAYDDAATIYTDLISRTQKALATINTGATGFTDLVYGGKMVQWKKFGNSLLLKLGVRLSDVNPGAATAAIQAAVGGGVFTSASDDFKLAYQGATPNTNPLWVDLVQSGRSDFVVANTIVDYMNTLTDPRRATYFDSNLAGGIYKGGIYGANNNFGAYTHIGTLMYTPTFRGDLMDLAEVQFMLAEAAGNNLGGLTSAAVETYYKAGITASLTDWKVASADIATYLANPLVAYATATGATWKEKVAMQYWLAMYNRGFEGWYVYRKLDGPKFNVAAVSQLPVPKRYTYPANENTLNGTNYTAAVTAIGGDKQQTRIFWDKF